MSLRIFVFLAFSFLSFATHADSDHDRILRDDVREYFTRHYPTHPRAYGRMDLTAAVPVNPSLGTEQIGTATNEFMEIGYVLVLDDVVCRIGLTLANTSPYTWGPPVQRVKAYCLPVRADLLDPDFPGDSYARQVDAFAQAEIDTDVIDLAVELRFADWSIDRISIDHRPGVTVRGVELFDRYRPYEHRRSTEHWEVSRVGDVDVTIRRFGPNPDAQSRRLGFALPLWTTCEGSLLSPGMPRVRIEPAPTSNQSQVVIQ